ncbi:MAG: redoxin domain-containing protein [Crenarchaeota archaeon]|nr:redoxin domain-containing protein [Thermoproteota archaeon]HJJ21434.1 redoxin domain-containing protein [Nitrosopumilus sp.]
MNVEIKTGIIFGGIIVTAIVFLMFLFIGLDEFTLTNQDSDTKKAPNLVGISHYLNTNNVELANKMEGKVILYDIWTYSCINCIRTLPYITSWNEKYSEQGLLIVGIHSPEFEFEKDPQNVKIAIEKYGITYPVVMDNDMKTWKAFENNYWPRKYIADHEGNLRYDHIGEGSYQETEKIIQQLLAERSVAMGLENTSENELVVIEEFEHTLFRTPELYFGYKFAQNRNQLGSEEGYQPGKIVTYGEPSNFELNKFYPIGSWKNHEDSMELTESTGTIKVSFNAKEVNIVTKNNARLEIFLDGIPLTSEYAGSDINFQNIMNVSNPGMYNIISSETSISRIMEIKIEGKGFQAFTFTFG